VSRRVLWFIGVIEVSAGLVVAWTWGAVAWTWGFPAFYVAFAFVVELMVRFKSTHVETAVQALLLSGTFPFVFAGFFGERWTEGAAPLHLGALTVSSTVAGLALALWVRPDARA
jgi:hypothetical protein